MFNLTKYRLEWLSVFFVFIAAFVLSAIPSNSHATMLNLSLIDLQGEFTGFDIPDGAGGTISTGTWNVEQNGPGTWAFDSTSGINIFTVDVLATFSSLPGAPAAQLTITESGDFMFASEDATGITGVWTANTGSGLVSALGTPLDGIAFSFNNQNDLISIAAAFPPFPPNAPMLAAIPVGFTELAPGTLPQFNVLETSGIFSLSGVLDVPGIANSQTFQGTGSFTAGSLTVVPEPSIVALWGIGFIVLLSFKSCRLNRLGIT